MAVSKLKELLATLSHEEQAGIILSFRDWMIADFVFGFERGTETMPPGGIESLSELDPGLEARLQAAIDRGDSKVLQQGVMELFRLLPVVQGQSNGARLNMFLSRRLPERVFRLLYGAAGLNVDDLRFPT
jgi:hypothetical protein